MGKCCITACTRPLPYGRFAAQMSIASGTGNASSDCVMRFVDDFVALDAAARHAVAQGINWVAGTLRVRTTHLYSNAVLSTRQSTCI